MQKNFANFSWLDSHSGIQQLGFGRKCQGRNQSAPGKANKLI